MSEPVVGRIEFGPKSDNEQAAALRGDIGYWQRLLDSMTGRCDTAEAERDRLRDLLRESREHLDYYFVTTTEGRFLLFRIREAIGE